MTKWLNTVLKLWKKTSLFRDMTHNIHKRVNNRQTRLYMSHWWQNPLLLKCYFSTKFIHVDGYLHMSNHTWHSACLFLNIKINYIIMERGCRDTLISKKKSPNVIKGSPCIHLVYSVTTLISFPYIYTCWLMEMLWVDAGELTYCSCTEPFSDIWTWNTLNMKIHPYKSPIHTSTLTVRYHDTVRELHA